MNAAVSGFGLGFFVALQLGPMSLLLIRSTLRSGWRFGIRTLYGALRVRVGGETAYEVGKPRRAFLTALGGTASNPSTIVSWGAIFAATTTAGLVHSTASAVLLVAGVAAGSLTWVTILATAVALARPAVGAGAIRVTDAVAGAGLIGFGGVLAYSTLVAPAGIEPARTV